MLWKERLAAERDRWPLWLPVALGTGAAAYFALPAEPSLLCGVLVLSLSGFAALLARPVSSATFSTSGRGSPQRRRPLLP